MEELKGLGKEVDLELAMLTVYCLHLKGSVGFPGGPALGLHASTARGAGSVSGWETKILQPNKKALERICAPGRWWREMEEKVFIPLTPSLVTDLFTSTALQ